MTVLGHVGQCLDYRVWCLKVAQSSVKTYISFTTDFKFRPSIIVYWAFQHTWLNFRHADNSCSLCILGIVRFPPSFSAYPGPFGTWHPKELKDLRRVPRMCIQFYTLGQRLRWSTRCRVDSSRESWLLQLDSTTMQYRVIPGSRNHGFDPASVFLSTHWWSQQPSLPVLFL